MPSLYVVLEKKIANANAYVNGNFLAKHNDELEELAQQAGVASLMSFFSMSKQDLPAVVEEHQLTEHMKSLEEQWFLADAGLHTVQTLLRFLRESHINDRDRIESELREFATLLELANASGVRWHLAVDY